MKRVSIKDIASKAGVVPSTVSIVLNGKAKEMRISDSVAERIIAVAKAEGYAPNHIAVSLRTGRSKMLGLIVEDISNPFFAALAKIIEEEANALGYKVVYCSTENNSEKGNDLIAMLSNSQVDGFIITPLPGMEKNIELLKKQGKPLVFMDRYLPGLEVPYVLLDNSHGVKLGMEHLLERGYRRIGFVTVELGMVQMTYRKKGYQDVLGKRGVTEDAQHILELPFNYQLESAKERVKTFIHDHRLDAIFFATNYLGILGIECFMQMGLKVPDDIAVVCFDDHDLFRLYPPGITTIRQPVKQIAQMAVGYLMQQLHPKEDSGIMHALLKAELVVRGST